MVDQSHKLLSKKPRLNSVVAVAVPDPCREKEDKKVLISPDKIFTPPSIRLSPLLAAQLLTSKSSPSPGPE